MTIYNVATGELDSVHRISQSATTNTSNAYYDSNTVDAAVQTGNEVGEVKFDFNASLGEFWLHMNLYYGSGGTGDTGVLFLFESSTGAELRVRTDGSNSSNRCSFRVEITSDGTSWTQLGSTVFIGPNAQAKFDMHVKFGTGGFVRMYRNGVRFFSHSATLTSQTNTASSVRIGGPRANATDVRTSELIVADTNTISMRLHVLRINAAGTTSQWDNAYTEIDDAAGAIDNNDYIHTAVVNDIMTFAMENPAPGTAVTTGRSISGLATTFAAFLPPDATPGDLRSVVRVAGTNYESADLNMPRHGGMHPLTHIWTTNPNTTIAWTTSDIDSAEIGVKAVT